LFTRRIVVFYHPTLYPISNTSVVNYAPSPESVWGSGGVAEYVILGTAWRCVISLRLRLLYQQGRSPWLPGFGHMAGLGILERVSLLPAGHRTPNIPPCSLINVPTTLFQLLAYRNTRYFEWERAKSDSDPPGCGL